MSPLSPLRHQTFWFSYLADSISAFALLLIGRITATKNPAHVPVITVAAPDILVFVSCCLHICFRSAAYWKDNRNKESCPCPRYHRCGSFIGNGTGRSHAALHSRLCAPRQGRSPLPAVSNATSHLRSNRLPSLAPMGGVGICPAAIRNRDRRRQPQQHTHHKAGGY